MVKCSSGYFICIVFHHFPAFIRVLWIVLLECFTRTRSKSFGFFSINCTTNRVIRNQSVEMFNVINYTLIKWASMRLFSQMTDCQCNIYNVISLRIVQLPNANTYSRDIYQIVVCNSICLNPCCSCICEYTNIDGWGKIDS